jgi:hypothetical protein
VAPAAFLRAADDDVLRLGSLLRQKVCVMTAGKTIAPVTTEAIEEALPDFCRTCQGRVRCASAHRTWTNQQPSPGEADLLTAP